MKKCNCHNGKCDNDSKAMYSVDYDSVIEELVDTRKKIDSLIHTLEARKDKDILINNILSSEYEDEEYEDEDDKEEKTVLSNIYIPYRYKRKYPWYPYITWY